MLMFLRSYFDNVLMDEQALAKIRGRLAALLFIMYSDELSHHINIKDREHQNYYDIEVSIL